MRNPDSSTNPGYRLIPDFVPIEGNLTMNDNPDYSKFHPNAYYQRIPVFWWTRKWAYAKFMLREFTSVFVAFYAIMLLIQVSALSRGPDSYDAFLEWLRSPGSLILHFIAFLFLLFHSFTWFHLARKAMVLRLGNYTIPGAAITASHYLAWIVVSAIIALILIIL